MSKSGYLSVTLVGGDGFKTYYRINRLVATIFVDNPNGYDVVNHLDEIKTNNSFSNLQWSVTRANINYSVNKRSSNIYPGVTWRSDINRWRARCNINGYVKHLGHYDSEKEAAQAYVDFCEGNNLIYKV